ncbi:hydroperoxide isomerase ALOXE3 [Platysternon megacephalum]|uniref:Hydroperoxide isomerase ALOXE3 n=1 Tax=Platysternon megacephalum TaxID=55544 RepID=A0A4D9DMP4_9SAUR|nr:hydroperoxide isomerase ALOXE3 [Platysternon megacephalum]
MLTKSADKISVWNGGFPQTIAACCHGPFQAANQALALSSAELSQEPGHSRGVMLTKQQPTCKSTFQVQTARKYTRNRGARSTHCLSSCGKRIPAAALRYIQSGWRLLLLEITGGGYKTALSGRGGSMRVTFI